jgi:phytoene synthase
MNAELEASYAACRRIAAAHGRTYYLATRLLQPEQQRAVHALYAFARLADDVVDVSTSTPEQKASALDALAHPDWDHPVAAAFHDTLRRWQIGHVEDFLTSMRMDLTTTSYATQADLARYTYGSAAVIGLQVLPVLGAVVPRAVAAPYAADLGRAFQHTNFLRDVGEDLDRGRLYLPLEDLDRHGVTRADLEARRLTPAIRSLLQDLVDRNRRLYAQAVQGIRLLDPTSRPCVEAACTLYAGILDEIERQGFPVLSRRVSVGSVRRARVAGPALLGLTVQRRPRTRASAARG